MNGPLIPDGLFNMLGVLPPQLTVATGRKKEMMPTALVILIMLYHPNKSSTFCKAEVQEVKVKVVCILLISITRNNNF